MNIEDFSNDLFSLAGRVAIVTGGNTGLGRAFTVALAAAGADVFVAALIDDDGTTRRLVEERGGRYEFMGADIAVRGIPGRVVSECVDRLGSIDILINSAGICLLADVDDFDRELWDPMLAVNLTAAFELAHEAGKRMALNGGGKIINIASLFSFLGGHRLRTRRRRRASSGSPRLTVMNWPVAASRSTPSRRDISPPRSPRRRVPTTMRRDAFSNTFPQVVGAIRLI